MRPLSLSLVLLVTLSARAGVTLTLGPIGHPPEAKVLVAVATLTNDTDEDLTAVTVDGVMPHSILAGQSDETWSCRDNGTLQSVRCTAPVIRAHTSVPVTFYIDALVGRFRLDVTARWHRDVYDEGAPPVTRQAVFARDVHVTHDGDGGAGSLRDALRLANEDCEGRKVPCRIVFDSAMTIRPATPLPVIWGDDVAIDGGGRVTLDGALLGSGNGLELDGTFTIAAIRGLTIRNFPWDGVHVRRAVAEVTDCVIESNAGRGISALAGMRILRNRIRKHGRAGVFLVDGHGSLIEDNEIDGNGASGVFANADDVVVRRNRIHGNAHFGVAVPRFANKSTITENAIFGNAVAGIDRGLDGPDGDRYDDNATRAAYIPPPRITSVTYDAASDATVIHGTYFDGRDHWGEWSLELFANSVREAQGETFLGTTKAAGGEFTFAAPGDLRGRFITATGHRRLYLGWSGDWWWTSEFSEPVDVR